MSRLHRALLTCLISAPLAACGQVGPVAAVSCPIGGSGTRVIEAPSAATDAHARRWAPDCRAQGGRLDRSSARVDQTATPELYRNARIGIRSLRIPVRTRANYLVVLYFAETRGERSGSRVFDVVAERRLVGTAVDVAANVGQGVPFHLPFTVRASDGFIDLRFVARRGATMLSAYKVTRVSPSLRVPATRLHWGDEFHGPAGSSPDPARWVFDKGGSWGRKQLQYYSDRPENASLDGRGHLVLTARNDGYVDPAGKKHRFTSARMTTLNRMAYRYGRVEARIRPPSGQGFVSQLWAEGSNVSRVGWPRAGEFDPMEVRGSLSDVLVQALHFPGDSPANRQIVWSPPRGRSLATAFHTYSVEWAPGVLVYRIDGSQHGSATQADLPPSAKWVFDKPVFLILNIVVGGDWEGLPDKTTRWPGVLTADWVRVWK